MAKLFKTTFKLRRGSTEVWKKNNPVLAYGEPGFEKDKYIFKIGDGKQHWKDLKPIGATVQADWNQNDETADDFIKNRLAWEESETIWEITDTMEAWQFEGEKVFDIEEGSEYIIEIDDVSYTTKARTINIEGITVYFIGDGTLVPDTPVKSTGEPFAIGVIPSEEIFVAFFFNPDNTKEYLSGTHTIRISKINVHKISPKFLPEKGFGYSETIDKIIFDSILEFVSEEPTLGLAFAEYVELKDGENYTVYLDDMKYECTAFTSGYPGDYTSCLGNPGVIDEHLMNDIPFIIFSGISSESPYLGIALFDPTKMVPLTGEHSVKIIHKTKVTHKIDPMFYDQLGWKKEKYESVFNIPVYFNSGESFYRFEAPLLQEGETYRVTYCGHTYEMKAEKATYMDMPVIGIGDIGLINDPPTPTAYPFVIGQHYTDSEYEVLVITLDPDAFPDEFIPMEGSQKVEVAHKKKIIQKIDPDLYERLAWEDKIVKEIIPETVIPGVYDQEVPFGITANTEYVVMFDGTEYRVTGRSLDASMDGTDIHIEFIGNPALFEIGEDSDLPFLVMDVSVYGMTMAGISCLDDTVDHTISVTGTVVDVHKIDEKFLPEFPLNRTIDTVNIDPTSTEALEFNGLITYESVMHIVIGGAKYDLPIVGSFGLQNISDVRTAVYLAGNKDLVEDAFSQVGISLEGAPYFDVPLACFGVGYEKDGKTYISDFMLLPQESAADVDSVSLDIVKYDRLDVAYLSPTNIMWDLNRDLPGTYSTDFENAYRCLQAGLTVRSTLDGEPVEIVQIEQSTPFAYITVRNNLGEYYKVTIQCVTNTKQVTKLSPDDFTLPSTVPNITSATENQMVVVEAVDESGKPTSWKAADVPERVGWKGSAEGSEIFNSKGNRALGIYSHAEGYRTIASGSYSHAEGEGIRFAAYITGSANALTYTLTPLVRRNFDVTGCFIFYEGVDSKIIDHNVDYSTSTIAITVETTLSENSLSDAIAYVFGSASGEYSHVEGFATATNDACSHAEGMDTEAYGHASHAEGVGTTASGSYQHVQGYYNIPDPQSVYAHIVGNGQDTITRSNAHTLSWDGNAWYAGDVYVGSTSGTNRDGGSEKLATEDYVKDAVQEKIATMAIPATSDMTEKVGVNAEGQLVTKPIGGGIVDHILMRDAENGFTYIIEMRGGNLVSSAMCTGIRIANAPDKIDYVEGDTIDVTGMIVEAVYEDGTSNVVEDYTYSELAPTDEILVISWVSRGVTYTASMKLNVTSMAEILVDFEYTDNGDGTYTLTDWKGTLNGEASTEIIIPDNSRIIV